MAARVMLQRRALAPLATLAIGGMAFVPAVAFAEGPEDFKRKPIYDDVDLIQANPAASSTATASPSSTISTLVSKATGAVEESSPPRGPTPTDRLAGQIGHARMFLYRHAVNAEDALNRTMDSALNLEQSFTRTIASLAPPRESGEKLMPGAIYVLVSAMAGSIITRNRNILLRASGPLVLGAVAANTLLPITSNNVSELVWQYEKKFPVIAESHVRARDSLTQGLSFAKAHGQVGAHYVDEKITEAREAVEDWVKKGK